jgi:hypothetical protein
MYDPQIMGGERSVFAEVGGEAHCERGKTKGHRRGGEQALGEW